MFKPLQAIKGKRMGNVRPFLGCRLSEDDAGVNLQAGFTTYGTNDDGQETYQVSYVEIGGRSDHIDDFGDNIVGNEVKERLVSDTAAHDVGYVGTAEENAKAAEKAARREERKAARKAKKADKKVTVVKPSDASATSTEAVA